MNSKCLCLVGIVLFAACGQKQTQIDRLYEDGVEIVLNHTKPYSIKGTPGSLRLEQELVIDTEQSDLAENGVVDIWGFDVNSQGDIYIFQSPMSVGKFISKFDASGRFLTSFAPKGQGPGEIQLPIFPKITTNDNLPVMDMITKKLLVFDEDGALSRVTEVPLDIKGSSLLLQLPTGNYLYRKIEWEPSREYPGLAMIYCLTDREYRDIRELDRVVFPQPFGVSRIRIPYPLTCWTVAGDQIYMGNPDKGYEIRVYNLGGDLVRKIRKEFLAVPFPESKKQGILKALESPQLAPLKSKLEFPKSSPPYQHLFCDDEGRLYVMTYESGEKSGEYIFDIFTPDGIFFARTSYEAYLSADLFAPGSPTDSWMMAKKGRLYAIREKPTGYKELVVYRMIWN